eukprot:5344969-Lingulodinium_polyedra.AAC.1
MEQGAEFVGEVWECDGAYANDRIVAFMLSRDARAEQNRYQARSRCWLHFHHILESKLISVQGM